MRIQPYSFIETGNQIAEMIARPDWTKTAIRSSADLPQSLKTTLNIVMGSQFPMLICWKKGRMCFYNDASRDQFDGGENNQSGNKEPNNAWPEIWHLINPVVDDVFLSGKSSFVEDQQISLLRNGAVATTYWSISYCPLLDELDTIAGVLITLVDITEKIEAFRDLKESNLQLSFAIEAAELGTFDYDAQSKKFRANRRLKNWFGLPDNAELALSLGLDSIVDHQREAVAAAIRDSFNPETDGRYEMEYTLKATDVEDERRVLAKGRVFFDENKEALRLSGTMKDITHQVAMQEKITFLAQLAEQSDDAIIAVKPDDTIVTWNAGAEKMYGYTAEEMIGKKLMNILRPDQGLTAPYDKPGCGNEIRTLRQETQHIRKDGHLLEVSLTVFPVKDEFGVLLGMASIARDVTEAKKDQNKKQADKVREQQLINRERLKAQEKERNKLGTDLHDNICQVLAAVKLKLGFFQGMQTEPSVIIRDCIKYVEEALVETRDISHKMIMPRFAEVSLESALGNLGNIYANDNRTVSITTENFTNEQLPVSPKEALYRIAQEQFNNMHKYSEASEVKVTLSIEEELVRFTIEDNGVGFDLSDKKTGIGLSNIRNRAELLNGFAKIVTAPGEGCFLLVQIPLEKDALT